MSPWLTLDYDIDNRLKSFETIESNPIEYSIQYDRILRNSILPKTGMDSAERRVLKEIETISKLPHDWNFDGAEPIDAVIIDNANQIASKLAPSILCLLKPENIYPTNFGTIIMDWVFDADNLVSLEIAKNAVAYFVERDGEILHRVDSTDIENAVSGLHHRMSDFV